MKERLGFLKDTVLRIDSEILPIVQNIKNKDFLYESFKQIRTINSLEDTMEEKQKIVQDQKLTGENNSEKILISGLINFGAEYMYSKNWDNLLSYFKNNGYIFPQTEKEHVIRFDKCGQYLVKIDGISLSDVFENKKIPDQFLVSAFNFIFISIGRNKIENLYDLSTIIDYPNEHIKNFYPKQLNGVITDCLTTAEILFSDDPYLDELINRKIVTLKGQHKEALIKIKNFQKKTKEIRQRTTELLFTPNSHHFDQFKITIEPILKNETLKYVVLDVFKCYRTEKIKSLYRNSQELLAQGAETKFYNLLLKTIKNYVEEGQVEGEILTEDDINSIFYNDSLIILRSDKPTFKSLKDSINNIFGKNRTQIYTPNPKNIDWEGLPEPKEINIIFDNTRPQKFEIKLEYENDWEETTTFKANYDCKKEFFDWSIIDDPNEMKLQKEIVFLITQKILTSIEKQITEEYDKNKQKKSEKAKNHQLKVKLKPNKERYFDPVYALKKIKPDTDINTLKPTECSDNNVVKKIIPIILSEDPKLFRYIDDQDIESVLNKINDHNKSGVGFIKTQLKKNKNMSYFRVNNIRVLLEKAKENGIESWKVINIMDRKDLYKKNGLKI